MENILFQKTIAKYKAIFKTLKIMLLIALLVFSGTIHAAGNESGKLVTLSSNNTSISNILKEVEKQTGYLFVFNASEVDLSKKISISVQKKSVQETLKQIFNGMDVSFEIEGKNILLKKGGKNAGGGALRQATLGQRQAVFVKGYVSDENSEPVAGATISEQGTNNITITDADGLFSIKASNGDAVLTSSYIGYQPRSISIKDKKFISFNMIPDKRMLEEVVVVGFGKQKKESLVGAVQSVKPEDLKMTSSSLTTTFAGKVPGVIARQTKGEPGYDNAEFYIRGIATFGSNTTPLILLDGAEINTTMMNNIPPESIASFSVLKDATATSLYGSRGANGVILINTKAGELSEKMSVNIRFDNTFSLPTVVQKMADGATYMEMFNQAKQNDAKMNGTEYSPFYSQDKIDKTRSGANPYLFPDNNWYDLLFKDYAVNQNLNATVKGGSKNIDYFLNAGIFLENGIVRKPKETMMDVGMYSRKYLFQSNVNAHLTPTTKMGLNMNAQITQYHAPFSGTDAGDLRGEMQLKDFFYLTMRGNPVRFPAVLPQQEGDTFVRYGNNTSWDVGNVDINPYAKMSSGYTEQSYVYMTTVFSLDQDLKFITPGLKATALASFYNYSFSWLNHWIQPYYYKVSDNYTVDDQGNYVFTESPIGTAGNTATQSASGQNPTNRVWSLQGTVDYTRSIGDHNLGATFVYHMKETRNDKSGGNEKELLPYREQGLAGRLTYNFAERYLMEATFGYNGSENFISGHRFGFFPAIAIGWTVSNEHFFQPVKNVVSNLKLRATYGLAGNDALGTRFPYITEVSLTNNLGWWYGSSFTQAKGPLISVYGNPNATWEKSRKTNFGVDVTLLGDLDISVDYFRENRTGIFMQRRSIPSTVGFAGNLPYANIGAVKNRGIDLSLAYRKAIDKDWIINLNGSFTYAHNEVTERDEPSNVEPYYSEVGHPINSIRGYIAEGLFTSQEEIDQSPKQTFSNYTIGNIKYKDLNNDGKIDGNDITTIGNPEIPEIVYGFGGTVKYKKLDVSLFFQGSGVVSLMMSDMHPFADAAHQGYNIAQYIVDDHWSESNNSKEAAYPRLASNFLQNDVQNSTYYLRDASYLRLKNAEIGYTFAPWIRMYISGSNLLALSSFKTWDPEMGSGNGLSYPLQKTVKIGFQFNY